SVEQGLALLDTGGGGVHQVRGCAERLRGELEGHACPRGGLVEEQDDVAAAKDRARAAAGHAARGAQQGSDLARVERLDSQQRRACFHWRDQSVRSTRRTFSAPSTS